MTNGDVAMIMSVGGLASGFSLLLGEDFLTSGVNQFVSICLMLEANF